MSRPASGIPITKCVGVMADKGETLNWPLLCVCCCGAANTSLPIGQDKKIGTLRFISQWKVPYCETCKKHTGFERERSSAVAILKGVGLIVLIFSGIAVGAEVGYPWLIAPVVFVIGMTLYALFEQWLDRKSPVMPGCATKKVAVLYSSNFCGQSGKVLHTFKFANERYAYAFEAAQDSKKLFGKPLSKTT